MFKDNKEDLLNRNLEFSMLSLFSKELRVGIIGAGTAGFIKAKHFLEEGCYVEVLYKEINEKFNKLKSDKLKLIEGKYKKDFIKDKHIVIIAIDDDECTKTIIEDCKNTYKIYINSRDFMEGMGSVPVKKDMGNFCVGINTKGGNPKGSIMLGEKVEESLKEYDDFIGFTTILRNELKKIDSIKREAIDFLFTDDFMYFYKKKKASLVMQLFYEEELKDIL